MNSLFDFQRGLYGDVQDALRAFQGQETPDLLALTIAALGLGMLHALLPGHGKSVLASYFAGEGRPWGAVLSSAVLILTHVGVAIFLVLGGFAILRTTIIGAGRAPVLEYASHALIVLIGLWLLWRSRRAHGHADASGRSGVTLGFVTGLVPCPLTTFVMSYAVANGVVAAGLFLSASFAAGMIVTVAAFPLVAVLMRSRLVAFLDRSRIWRGRISRSLEVISVTAIVMLGVFLHLRDAAIA